MMKSALDGSRSSLLSIAHSAPSTSRIMKSSFSRIVPEKARRGHASDRFLPDMDRVHAAPHDMGAIERGNPLHPQVPLIASPTQEFLGNRIHLPLAIVVGHGEIEKPYRIVAGIVFLEHLEIFGDRLHDGAAPGTAKREFPDGIGQLAIISANLEKMNRLLLMILQLFQHRTRHPEFFAAFDATFISR